ncbi:pyruvate dehydrogenase (acetyl-transferring) E1 component subunit alpha, partial [Candidatus Aerophobetes bacterium]|nr:pyruvate dehydrogenase (acetyl-transferring) E1 component subunit alpha [Candidatus Aerophobetes bacterium]
RRMLEVRYFEEAAVELFQAGRLPGFLHSYLGEEAVAVGVCSALEKGDYITSTHRGHGHVIAKGASLEKMMAELFGKKTGYCKGKGGSMHIADFSIGVVGATGIVGSGIPIATGVALACKMKKTGQVVACFFGDGASNTGAFHEGLNLASVWDLPVIFVCENNLYAESTPQREHQKIKDVSIRAVSYNMPGVTVDGNDVIAVFNAAKKAVERARKGEGPTLIECKTYRWMGHYIGDPAVYRSREEVEEWKKRCPIKNLKNKLLKEGVFSQEELTGIEEEVKKSIKEAIEFAEKSPVPELKEALEDIYS